MERAGEERIALLKRGLTHCNDTSCGQSTCPSRQMMDKEVLYRQAIEECQDMIIPFAQYLVTAGDGNKQSVH